MENVVFDACVRGKDANGCIFLVEVDPCIANRKSCKLHVRRSDFDNVSVAPAVDDRATHSNEFDTFVDSQVLFVDARSNDDRVAVAVANLVPITPRVSGRTFPTGEGGVCGAGLSGALKHTRAAERMAVRLSMVFTEPKLN